jgi:hypothetical protein
VALSFFDQNCWKNDRKEVCHILCLNMLSLGWNDDEI